ncbi:MAG: TrmJ/YjtD family RNA methyltransferase [Spirochaetia bacterium]|nr:TrmJ/YjtD family RNA methyltransferase [Spirochaetia bacterium]
MENLKDRIRIVLVNPDDSHNIGAVCRSMMTMGINQLYIAKPSGEYDTHQIEYMSVHAYDIFKNAKIVPELKDAISDTVLSLGTSRRVGKKRKYRTFLPEEMCDRIMEIKDGTVAIVFGNEEHGLTDEELSECSAVVSIPTSDEFPSLNLSHAVQIMCYHIFRATEKKQKRNFSPAKISDIDDLSDNLIENMRKIGFFKIDGSQDMKVFFRDIFTRAMLSKEESVKLDRIFSKIAGIKGKIARGEYQEKE